MSSFNNDIITEFEFENAGANLWKNCSNVTAFSGTLCRKRHHLAIITSWQLQFIAQCVGSRRGDDRTSSLMFFSFC